jgi:tRNA 2-thiouridine synthesizing protein A
VVYNAVIDKYEGNYFSYVNFRFVGGLKLGKRIKPDRELDCVGLYCPEPVFRTRQAIDKLDVNQILEVVADDPAAEEDIPRLVKRLELELLELRKENGKFHFIIKKTN